MKLLFLLLLFYRLLFSCIFLQSSSAYTLRSLRYPVYNFLLLHLYCFQSSSILFLTLLYTTIQGSCYRILQNLQHLSRFCVFLIFIGDPFCSIYRTCFLRILGLVPWNRSGSYSDLFHTEREREGGGCLDVTCWLVTFIIHVFSRCVHIVHYVEVTNH